MCETRRRKVKCVVCGVRVAISEVEVPMTHFKTGPFSFVAFRLKLKAQFRKTAYLNDPNKLLVKGNRHYPIFSLDFFFLAINSTVAAIITVATSNTILDGDDFRPFFAAGRQSWEIACLNKSCRRFGPSFDFRPYHGTQTSPHIRSEQTLTQSR